MHLLPIGLLLCLTQAQFIYPPPLEGSLADYISGTLQSKLNFSASDDLIGSWRTPYGLKSFLLYRCSHSPSSTPSNATSSSDAPIYPSNATFSSDTGFLDADGTWVQMPDYDNGMFDNGYNAGKKLFYAPTFYLGNSTTGDICWFELYPGGDTRNLELDSGQYGRHMVTVHGDGGSFYFASQPFIVKPARRSGLVVTWRSDGTERGKPTRKIGMNSTSDSESASTGDDLESTSGDFVNTFPQNKSGAQAICAGWLAGLLVGVSVFLSSVS